MSELFLIQLLTSFIAGGLAVTLLTLIAERCNPRTAGIVLSMPTNLAVSLFFIGWTLSPNAIAQAAIGIPASLGASMIFTATYVFVATQFRSGKISSMLSALIIGLAAWSVLAIPLAVYKIHSILLSLTLYAVTTYVSHWWLTREPVRSELNSTIRYTNSQKLGRAIFAGTIIMMIVYLSKTLGPLWGGIFSVFPAANSSALLILHWQRDAQILKKVSRNMPLGSPIFLIYTLTSVLTFPHFGIIIGTILSYTVSFVALWIYLKLLNRSPG